MRALAVLVAVPCGLVGGLVVGLFYGALAVTAVPAVPDGLVPLLMMLLGGWVAGYGTFHLIRPRAPRRLA